MLLDFLIFLKYIEKMQEVLLCLLLGTLGIIFYQDWKERMVSWILFPTAFLLEIGYFSSLIPLQDLFFHFAVNLIIILSLLMGMIFYLFFRFRRKRFRLWEYFGCGDLLFLLVLAIGFSPFNFVLFTILSLSFSLLLSFFLLHKNNTVPLAGFQSIVYGLFLLFHRIVAVNPFNEYWIYQWI